MVAKVKPSSITNIPPAYAIETGTDFDALVKIVHLNFFQFQFLFVFFRWLMAKRNDDNVEDGLWRIKNGLYDLKDFIKSHPGGSDWIRMTEGHDITEAFITHHISMEKVEPFLKKFYVRETTRPRNVKLTFDDDGFYMTLKRKVAAELPEIKKRTKINSNVCVRSVDST